MSFELMDLYLFFLRSLYLCYKKFIFRIQIIKILETKCAAWLEHFYFEIQKIHISNRKNYFIICRSKGLRDRAGTYKEFHFPFLGYKRRLLLIYAGDNFQIMMLVHSRLPRPPMMTQNCLPVFWEIYQRFTKVPNLLGKWPLLQVCYKP